MKLSILAIGKARKSPEAELWADWLKRCPFPATLQEFDSRLPPGPARTEEESRKILVHVQHMLLSIDEHTEILSLLIHAYHHLFVIVDKHV